MNVRRTVAVIVAFGAVIVGGPACADDDAPAGTPTTSAPVATRTAAAPGIPAGPKATLIAGQLRVPGGHGTRCWEGGCIDYAGPVTNASPIPAAPGSPFEIEFEEGTPDEVTLSWYVAPDTVPPASNGVIGWSVDPGTATPLDGETIPDGPGRYLLAAFARWDGKGDIVYGWYIEVR
jgi:hypothetical protein